MDRPITKWAVVFCPFPSDTVHQVEQYLPDNYRIVPNTATRTPDGKMRVGICGEDFAGWTLEDYVAPRLASGNYGVEVCRDLEHVRDRTVGVMD